MEKGMTDAAVELLLHAPQMGMVHDILHWFKDNLAQHEVLTIHRWHEDFWYIEVHDLKRKAYMDKLQKDANQTYPSAHVVSWVAGLTVDVRHCRILFGRGCNFTRSHRWHRLYKARWPKQAADNDYQSCGCGPTTRKHFDIYNPKLPKLVQYPDHNAMPQIVG